MSLHPTPDHYERLSLEHIPPVGAIVDRVTPTGATGSATSPGDPEIVQAEYDFAAVAPSTAVVETVAVVTGADQRTLGPLCDAIDPDSLDRLVRLDETDTETPVRISLSFAGHDVTVRSDGTVLVDPARNE